MADPLRVPRGVPSGGRFTAAPHAEAEVSLAGNPPVIDLGDLGRCPACDGRGAHHRGNACVVCEGSGSLSDDASWERAQVAESACTVTCTECDEGLVGGTMICPACDGSGKIVDYSLAV